MKCHECKHWRFKMVCPGSRRVVGECQRPGGPMYESGDTFGPYTYDDNSWCVVGEPHGDLDRLFGYFYEVLAGNEALDKEFGGNPNKALCGSEEDDENTYRKRIEDEMSGNPE